MKNVQLMVVLLGSLPLFALGGGAGAAQNQGAVTKPGARIRIDASRAKPTYANFVRVTGSPEELIIDFGLNAQPIGVPKEAIVIDHRIVMNYFTAKRMLAALETSLKRHEAVFGPIETDIQKRIQRRQTRSTSAPSHRPSESVASHAERPAATRLLDQ